MNLLIRLDEMENHIKALQDESHSAYPTWVSMSSHLASQYGYTLDGFRNYCLSNVKPELFQKFGNKYSIHKSAFVLLKNKKKIC